MGMIVVGFQLKRVIIVIVENGIGMCAERHVADVSHGNKGQQVTFWFSPQQLLLYDLFGCCNHNVGTQGLLNVGKGLALNPKGAIDGGLLHMEHGEIGVDSRDQDHLVRFRQRVTASRSTSLGRSVGLLPAVHL